MLILMHWSHVLVNYHYPNITSLVKFIKTTHRALELKLPLVEFNKFWPDAFIGALINSKPNTIVCDPQIPTTF